MEYIIRTQASDSLQESNYRASGCGYWMRFFIFGIFLTVQTIYGADSGIEILKNGTFKNDSSWYLAVNGDASAKHVIENNMLSVSITTQGSESWFIQLTQNKVNVKKDKRYVLSFEIKSSQPRTILTSVCKDGGDYLPYSLRDTVKFDTSFFRYSQEFRMVQPSDSVARVEFNFGSFKGDIQLKNVSLIEYFEPKINFIEISPQSIAFSDEPIKVSWTSVGLQDTLKLSVSYDYGLSWSVIQSNLKAVDSLEWIPGNTHSAWCLFKLSTVKTSAISTTPLEIIPKIELISNGSFRNSYTNWILTTDTSVVQNNMIVQNSTLTLSSTYKKPSEGAVKFSQSSIKLEKGNQYDVFFTCSAKTVCSLLVYLTDCTTLLTTGNNGAENATFGIDSTTTRYNVRFVSNKSTTNGELQFFPDTAAKEISFSNISLVNVSISAPALTYSRYTHDSEPNQFRQVFLSGKTQSRIPFSSTSEYFNLSGRKISGKQLDLAYLRFHGSGVVIVVPQKNDRNKKFDNK